MRIDFDEPAGLVRVESNGTVIVELRDFPVAPLKKQLRDWLNDVNEVSAKCFIFASDDLQFHGTFRIEPRPQDWQFTSCREYVRSPELLSLGEWRSLLQECAV
jgi:hypothetical protein